MADFCAGCTVEVMDMPAELNDFKGWLDRRPSLEVGTGYAWLLCEGCGHHAFNNAGESRCTQQGERTRVAWTWCERCTELLRDG